jgi:uncharacterized membrane protein YeaQ/YmgE (transglycosylase-associated protein family)
VSRKRNDLINDVSLRPGVARSPHELCWCEDLRTRTNRATIGVIPTSCTISLKEKEMLSGLIWAVIVGLIAGWLAGKVMKGGGYGVPMDIIVGIVGGVIGRFVFGLLGLSASGLTGSIIVSFVGAVILIWLVRRLRRA